MATALQFVKDIGVDQFQDVEGTILFLKTIDHLFDILNSRLPFAKGYKEPLTPSNFYRIREYLDSVEIFINSLFLNSGKKLLESKQYTGFIGFIFCARSFVALGHELLFVDQSPLKYVLAYKFSQDHLELFFNAVRGTLGWNNNPSARQFKYIFRRFLAHVGVTATSDGNCLNFTEKDEEFVVGDLFEETEFNPTSQFIDCIATYIAGFVVRDLTKHSKCDQCNVSLIKPSSDGSSYHFLRLKNNGGLLLPSNDVTKIVRMTEVRFKALPPKQRVYRYIVPSILFDTLGSSEFSNDHFYESGHRIKIIQSIVISYCKIRSFHEIRKSNTSDTNFMRPRLSKQIHFMSQ